MKKKIDEFKRIVKKTEYQISTIIAVQKGIQSMSLWLFSVFAATLLLTLGTSDSFFNSKLVAWLYLFSIVLIAFATFILASAVLKLFLSKISITSNFELIKKEFQHAIDEFDKNPSLTEVDTTQTVKALENLQSSNNDSETSMRMAKNSYKIYILGLAVFFICVVIHHIAVNL